MKTIWECMFVIFVLATFHLVVIATGDVKNVPMSHGTGVVNATYKNSLNNGNNHTLSGNQTEHTGNHSEAGGHEVGHKKGHGSSHGSDSIHLVEINFEHVKNPLVFGLVVIIAGLSKIGFHHSNFLSSKVPESCILILLGVVLGAIIHFTKIGEDLDFFQPHEFFLYLLPPIILEAAFSLHDRTFSENIGSILLFSVVGTVLACFMLGLTLIGLSQVPELMEDPGCDPVQIFVFSALIVAVDPVAVLAIFQEVGVNNMLYFIVFGESLLNDGVTVVLYNVMQTYNRMEVIEADQVVLGILKFFVVVFGGLLIGILHGLMSSFLTKYTNSVKVVEPIIIFGFAYQSYILAEMFHFSGIVSIIGCGLTQMQYTINNITNKSKLAVKFFAKVMSNTCEIIIFLFLGLKVVNDDHVWNTGFVLWTTVLCIVYRFIITYGMAFLINRCDTYRVRKIKLDEMFMISYGGLRGAVCFSLVALLNKDEFPMKNMFVTTTIFVIFFTVFVQGGSIKWLVKKMRVSLQDSRKDMILYQELHAHISDHLMAGIEEVVGYSGKYYLREKFDRLDNRFIRPIFLRDPKKCDVDDINQYYEKLMMKEHYKNLRLCGASNLPRVGSDLRQVDSSVCLKVMGDEYEQRQLEKEEKIADRRSRLKSQHSMEQAQRPEGADLQRVFRNALASTRNKATVRYHDKNFIGDEKRHFVGNLRSKYKKNVRLSTIRHPTFERALSWNEKDTDLCTRRTSDVKLNLRSGFRSQTVDLSPLESSGSDFDRITPTFMLEDPVFEVDETDNPEIAPLLNKVNGMSDKSTEVENDDKQIENSKHVKFEEGAGSRSPDKRLQTRTQSHQHSGHLSRQNALKDAEIQMQELGKDKDKSVRQNSV